MKNKDSVFLVAYPGGTVDNILSFKYVTTEDEVKRVLEQHGYSCSEIVEFSVDFDSRIIRVIGVDGFEQFFDLVEIRRA